MLQLSQLNQHARRSLSDEGEFPPPWNSPDELEHAADEALQRLRDRRSELSARRPWWRLCNSLDRAVYSEAVEYLDQPDYPPEQKLHLVRLLHELNKAYFSYHRFLHYLRPSIARLSQQLGRPVRGLELASGSGELTMELARLAQKRGLPVEITGSDIVPAYVEDANERAEQRGLPARIIELNAFDMSTLDGSYDLMFITQSIHHFSAGQLARMIAQAGAAGAHELVGIDGRRCVSNLVILPMTVSLWRTPHFVHDAFLSARRFYADAELELIATMAAPTADVRVRAAQPGMTQLNVCFQ